MQVCFLSNVCVLSCSYLEFKYTVLLLDQDQESVYMHTAHTIHKTAVHFFIFFLRNY